MSETDGPEVIHPPTTLRDKVSVSEDGVYLATLERAEQLVADMQGAYLEWVEDDLKKLTHLYEDALCKVADRSTLFGDMFSLSHDIKGQGGSFNYPLMTMIGTLLCRFLERCKDDPQDTHMAVIKVHMDSMRLVISQRMEGDGGAAGKTMVRGLEETLAKVMPSKEDPA